MSNTVGNVKAFEAEYAVGTKVRIRLPTSASPSTAAASEMVPPGGDVARGVVQQVRDDLRHPHLVDIDDEPVLGDVDRQPVMVLLDERQRELDARQRGAGQLGRAPSQLDLAVRDALDVEQIVDETHQVAELALDDVEPRRPAWSSRPAAA